MHLGMQACTFFFLVQLRWDLCRHGRSFSIYLFTHTVVIHNEFLSLVRRLGEKGMKDRVGENSWNPSSLPDAVAAPEKQLWDKSDKNSKKKKKGRVEVWAHLSKRRDLNSVRIVSLPERWKAVSVKSWKSPKLHLHVWCCIQQQTAVCKGSVLLWQVIGLLGWQE